MLQLTRTDASNVHFQKLVKQLDADLAIRDGDDHDFYHQFNGIDTIKYVVVAYLGQEAVACGAIKHFDEKRIEVKRMYVPLANRRNGYAMMILSELQSWAKELNYQSCILETGYNQPEAIKLYHKAKFEIIENYGQYAGVKNSICFGKIVT